MNAQAGRNGLSQMTVETDIAVDGIDWDITLDSSQIDWDIGTVEETEENGNGLGPYEIVVASDIMSPPCNDDVTSHQTLEGRRISAPEVSASEISWGIYVDNPQVDVIEEDSSQNNAVELHSFQNNLTADSVAVHDRSPLLETEYRNKILDDLFEVKAFLNQRLIELRIEDTTSLQHQVQAVAPLVLQQYSSDIIQTMLSDVSSAISLLTNRKTRDMIMILNSKRFLDRLVNTLRRVRQAAKLKMD
ncbi:hypothetical protein HAX54_028087 [Datura stramonium]|uniref:Uncharacterized protein n=1 Tax=Datura stramonium TaxID=4076 RepID=A0ABS8V4C9_DATST|nr:hypothetical protein [Datura stramonium]